MEKPFYVYFVPKTHHDLGYTQPIDQLLKTYCRYYDDVLDFCDNTAGYPPEAQYRYTVESFWSLDYYLKHTSEANRERMRHYVKNGRIEIQAFYANVIDGICSEEEIARLMYPSAAYVRECGRRLTSGALTDIPGMSAGVIKALSGAGIPYLFVGFPTYFEWEDCGGKPVNSPNSFWDEKKLFGWGHPAAFRWKALDKGEVFAWYQFGYGHMSKVVRTVFEADVYEEVKQQLPEFVDMVKASGSPYHVMRYVHHGMDNVAPSCAISDVVERWNREHQKIKCIVATETMFFEALQKDCREAKIKTVLGELPHTDYTICSLAEAGISALNARTKEKLQMLEKCNALKSLSGDGRDITTQMEAAYADAILYDEHCFGMETFGFGNQYNRSLKINYAFRAAQRAESLTEEDLLTGVSKKEGAYTLLGTSGIRGEGIGTGIWCQKREEKEEEQDQEQGYLLIDSEGNEICVQCDVIEDKCLPICGLLDTYAMKLPEEVIKQYTFGSLQKENLCLSQLHGLGKKSVRGDRTCGDSAFENRFYRIEFDRKEGGVKKIYDKEIGREITDGEALAGQIVVRDIETGHMYQPRMERMYHRMSGPVADSMVIYASVYSVPLFVMEVTLYHTMKRIDFSYRLVLDKVPLREAFVVFPFCMKEPQFTFQGIGTPVRAFEDIIEGANTNQYACQHWCQVKGKDSACVLAMREARVIEVGGIHPTAVSQAHRHLSPEGYDRPYITRQDISNGHLVSMILYNNCQTNFPPTQQGEVLYHYAVTSGNNVKAESFAENFVHPPRIVAGKADGGAVILDRENLCITCLKRAEDGQGIIVRIKETEGRMEKTGIRITWGNITSVWKCNVLEEKLGEIASDEILVDPYETVTLRIETDS